MSKLEAAFQKFDAANPRVFELFSQFAFEAIKAGRTHVGSTLVFERVRWETTVKTISDDVFKLSNNHRPYYARKFNAMYPEYNGFFPTRQTAAEAGRLLGVP